jgi:hypothetical protein
MRAIVWTMLGIGITLSAVPAQAQTYGSFYPICLQTYGRNGNNISCEYTSMGPCRATAMGRAAQCITNPYFNSSGRPLWRHQH